MNNKSSGKRKIYLTGIALLAIMLIVLLYVPGTSGVLISIYYKGKFGNSRILDGLDMTLEAHQFIYESTEESITIGAVDGALSSGISTLMIFRGHSLADDQLALKESSALYCLTHSCQWEVTKDNATFIISFRFERESRDFDEYHIPACRWRLQVESGKAGIFESIIDQWESQCERQRLNDGYRGNRDTQVSPE